jgi:hypothetical protein
MEKVEKFEQWCIVELFGHQRVAGFVTEQTIGGCSFVRVDVPAKQPYTRLFGNGAIYGITITDESTARKAAEYFAPQPMDQWTAQQLIEDKLVDAEFDPDYCPDNDKSNDDMPY